MRNQASVSITITYLWFATIYSGKQTDCVNVLSYNNNNERNNNKNFKKKIHNAKECSS